MKAIEEFAPAKINLTLHVTGRRADGYHLLDSLVMFADVGDKVAVEPSGHLGFSLRGPLAGTVPQGNDNLVLRAARLFGGGAEITLFKYLPMAAGLGGGSSDAAATLRALSRMSGRAIPENVLSLGADVPVCLTAQAARMAGIGDVVRPVHGLPAIHAVLVNPGVALSTPKVFGALETRENVPMSRTPAAWNGAAGFCEWLAQQRNDLEVPARSMAPILDNVLNVISAADGCMLSRMSGSGATCFGLFDNRAEADRAAAAIALSHPQWWARSATLG